MIDDDSHFSVIKFFRYVTEKIEAINTPPLSSVSLQINSDAYRELGGEFDESDQPFAHIALEFPTSNNDLIFATDFYPNGIGVSVGSFDYTFCHYEHLGDDEKQVAARVVDMLTTLANGQLGVLITYTEDDDKIQALEVLYKKPKKAKYDAIRTYPVFESARKLKNRELRADYSMNKADIDEAKLDVDMFLNFLPQPPGSDKYSRSQIQGLHAPLSRAEWESRVDEHYEEKTDEFISKVDAWAKKDDLSFKQQIIKYSKWRHLEILWWSAVLVLFTHIVSWNFSAVSPYAIGFVLVIALVTLFRNMVRYNVYLLLIQPVAYIASIVVAAMFLGTDDKNIWWWIVAVCWVFSALEVIVFDMHMFIKELRPEKKSHT